MFRPPGAETPAGVEADEEAPNPQQRGKNRAQLERYAGLSPLERRTMAWNDLQTWAGGMPVFWFARSLEAVDAALPEGADYRTVAEIDAPMMMAIRVQRRSLRSTAARCSGVVPRAITKASPGLPRSNASARNVPRAAT